MFVHIARPLTPSGVGVAAALEASPLAKLLNLPVESAKELSALCRNLNSLTPVTATDARLREVYRPFAHLIADGDRLAAHSLYQQLHRFAEERVAPLQISSRNGNPELLVCSHQASALFFPRSGRIVFLPDELHEQRCALTREFTSGSGHLVDQLGAILNPKPRRLPPPPPSQEPRVKQPGLKEWWENLSRERRQELAGVDTAPWEPTLQALFSTMKRPDRWKRPETALEVQSLLDKLGSGGDRDQQVTLRYIHDAQLLLGRVTEMFSLSHSFRFWSPPPPPPPLPKPPPPPWSTVDERSWVKRVEQLSRMHAGILTEIDKERGAKPLRDVCKRYLERAFAPVKVVEHHPLWNDSVWQRHLLQVLDELFQLPDTLSARATGSHGLQERIAAWGEVLRGETFDHVIATAYRASAPDTFIAEVWERREANRAVQQQRQHRTALRERLAEMLVEQGRLVTKNSTELLRAATHLDQATQHQDQPFQVFVTDVQKYATDLFRGTLEQLVEEVVVSHEDSQARIDQILHPLREFQATVIPEQITDPHFRRAGAVFAREWTFAMTRAMVAMARGTSLAERIDGFAEALNQEAIASANEVFAAP